MRVRARSPTVNEVRSVAHQSWTVRLVCGLAATERTSKRGVLGGCQKGVRAGPYSRLKKEVRDNQTEGSGGIKRTNRPPKSKKEVKHTGQSAKVTAWGTRCIWPRGIVRGLDVRGAHKTQKDGGVVDRAQTKTRKGKKGATEGREGVIGQ